MNARRVVRFVMFYAALLAVWQGVCGSGLVSPDHFPSPVQVGRSVWAACADGTLLRGIALSLRRQFVGYIAAVAIGTLLGVTLWRFKFLEEHLGPLILALQTLPGICWLPLALLWFGESETAVIFVVVVGSLLSITIAVDNGIKQVPPNIVRAAQMMGVKGWRLYTEVLLPASLPAFVEGLKQGWVFAWRALMAGELIFSSRGLGDLLNLGRKSADLANLLAVIGAIVTVGILADRLVFTRLQVWVQRRWGLEKK